MYIDQANSAVLLHSEYRFRRKHDNSKFQHIRIYLDLYTIFYFFFIQRKNYIIVFIDNCEVALVKNINIDKEYRNKINKS